MSPTEAAFDIDVRWQLHDKVQLRPERFGALLYHYGTRRLSFLKSPELLTVVKMLESAATARDAIAAAGVTDVDAPAYRRALASLAASDMIARPTSSTAGSPS
jgi:putative mycofactocin binding protein MftB